MSVFSKDSDILRYEPVLFSELYFRSQVLIKGSGAAISDGHLSSDSASFLSSGVSGGGVVYVSSDSGVDNLYEIVSVDSETQLSLSVVRSGSDESSVLPADATDLFYRVSTFEPQAAAVFLELTEYFGLRPGRSDSEYGIEDLMDTDGLRIMSALAVTALVYASVGGSENDESYWQKSRYYQRLYEKARERYRVNIDSGDDGVAESSRTGGCARLVRD